MLGYAPSYQSTFTSTNWSSANSSEFHMTSAKGRFCWLKYGPSWDCTSWVRFRPEVVKMRLRRFLSSSCLFCWFCLVLRVKMLNTAIIMSPAINTIATTVVAAAGAGSVGMDGKNPSGIFPIVWWWTWPWFEKINFSFIFKDIPEQNNLRIIQSHSHLSWNRSGIQCTDFFRHWMN